jgi:CheY-like chemotaxis protein
VVGTFGDGAALAREAAVLRPGVAILDLDLPGGNGAQLALRLRRTLPDLGVVLLAGPSDAGLLAALPAEGMPNWMYLVNPNAHGITTLLRAIQVTDARLIDLGGAPGAETPWPARRCPSCPASRPASRRCWGSSSRASRTRRSPTRWRSRRRRREPAGVDLRQGPRRRRPRVVPPTRVAGAPVRAGQAAGVEAEAA